MTPPGRIEARSYEVVAFYRWLPVVLGPATVVVGVVATIFTGGAIWIPLLAVGVVGSVVQLRRALVWPHRIDVDPAGLRFVAWHRTTAVAWSELHSVSVGRRDFARHIQIWRWSGGTIWIWNALGDTDQLLAEILDAQPHVTVEV